MKMGGFVGFCVGIRVGLGVGKAVGFALGGGKGVVLGKDNGFEDGFGVGEDRLRRQFGERFGPVAMVGVIMLYGAILGVTVGKFDGE